MSEQKELKHSVIKAMACTMSEYSMRDLSKLYGNLVLASSTFSSAINRWVYDGILTVHLGDYGIGRQYAVAPTLWVDVMREVDESDLVLLLEFFPAENEHCRHDIVLLARAAVRFLHNQSYVDLLDTIDWRVLASCHSVVDIMQHVGKQLEMVDFVKHFGSSFLYCLYVDYENRWSNMQLIADLRILRPVFFDNPRLNEHIRSNFRDVYVLYVELFQTGRLDDLLKKTHPDGEIHRQLKALKCMHDNDPEKAFKILSATLNNNNQKFFYDPFFNFVYGMALALSNSAKAVKTAEQLLKNREANSKHKCFAMLLVLHYLVMGDADKFLREHPLSTCFDRMSYFLACLFLRHYHVVEPEPDELIQAVQVIKDSDLDYLKLLFANEFDQLKGETKRLSAQTGLKGSFLPTVEHEERWEAVLAQVMRISSQATGKKAQSTADQRVAYFVDLDSFDVQPKLQKSKDGGVTWSKGRNIALKGFGAETFLTPQDRKVASLVKSYTSGWYGNQLSYELEGEKVIAALAGCGSVYDDRTGERLDIVDEPLQLQVLKSANGYTVRSNVDMDYAHSSGFSISVTGNKVSVTEVTSSQLKILELLRGCGVFPPKSKKRLTELLESLSSNFVVMSPLLKNTTELKRVEANSLIAVQVKPVDYDTFSANVVVKPFGDRPPLYSPGKGMEIVSATIDGETMQTERDMNAELAHLDRLYKILDFRDMDIETFSWEMNTSECLQLLEKVRSVPDAAYIEWPQGEKMRVLRPMVSPDRLRLQVSSAGQWFEVEGDLDIGEHEKLKIAVLLEKLSSARSNFIRLNDDEYLALNEQLVQRLQVLDKLMNKRGKKLQVSQMNALQLTDLEGLGAKLKTDRQFKQLVKRIHEADKLDIKLPAALNAELRPYQVEGYKWMTRLAHWGAGACLADDMGLGKTLQAIAMMVARCGMGPQLVVMPTSVLLNWQQELQRFAPTLKVNALNHPGADRKALVGQAQAGDVVLMTYGLLVTEGELLASRTWATIVLDEAHTIKNRDTLTSKATMNLKGDFRLLLTGTPLQNHLNEIWNLYEFSNPGLLGSYIQFTAEFMVPIERNHDMERQQQLRRILSPFMLRRTKEDVLNDLPEKTEITLPVELSKDEMALYETLRQQAIANIEGGSKSIVQTLAEITRLRQAACHPRLVDDKLTLPSSKSQAFLELVGNLMDNGHRALVFSQFTSHLALIREELDKLSINYLYLDGSTSPTERNRLVRAFQMGSEPLFLISLKAGGLGLNLTAADYVIHLDPWWNPAIEDQASDRAHRIGQDKPVTVYRLIAAGTIEDKIMRLHQHKRGMADALLQDANLFSQITADDVIRLLRERIEDIN